MPPLLFNARDPRYRNPLGAVVQGTSVFLRICLPREWHCSGATLLIHADQQPDAAFGMFWAGMEGFDHEWWDCHFTKSSFLPVNFLHRPNGLIIWICGRVRLP